MTARIARFTLSLIAVLVTVLVLQVFCPLPAFAEVEEDEEEASKLVVPEDQWTDEAKLWLARSVIGEAGWKTAGSQEEYSAIAYVYAVRAEQSKSRTFLEMVRTYSAAVKNRRNTKRPWLYELGFEATRPRSWPFNPETKMGPRWKGVHEVAWRDTLAWADEWQAGEHENPCPGANHFGGYLDRHRAKAARWTPIKCSAKTWNRFYTSLRLQPKRGVKRG